MFSVGGLKQGHLYASIEMSCGGSAQVHLLMGYVVPIDTDQALLKATVWEINTFTHEAPLQRPPIFLCHVTPTSPYLERVF